MFLRKIFSSENKLVWVFVDLVIVIVGVYCAFLIQEYSAQEKTKKEKLEIISAMKYELEFFRIIMPGRAWYSNNQVQHWEKLNSQGQYIDFSGWRFIEPQYQYQVLERVLNIQNGDLINFELFQYSLRIYEQIRRIEHTERMITEVGFKYRSIPDPLNEKSSDFQLLNATNQDNFRRLIDAMKIRGEIQQLLAERSSDALTVINQALPFQVKKQIEEELIVQYIDNMVETEVEAVERVSLVFPDFSEEEIKVMYQQATQQ